MTKMIQLIEEMGARTQPDRRRRERTRARTRASVEPRRPEAPAGRAQDYDGARVRRGAILHELQGLATRIGAFPVARQPTSSVEYAEPVPRPITAANGVPEANPIPTANGVAGANGHVGPFSRGDWRHAASNIEDDLDDLFKQRRVAVNAA